MWKIYSTYGEKPPYLNVCNSHVEINFKCSHFYSDIKRKKSQINQMSSSCVTLFSFDKLKHSNDMWNCDCGMWKGKFVQVRVRKSEKCISVQWLKCTDYLTCDLFRQAWTSCERESDRTLGLQCSTGVGAPEGWWQLWDHWIYHPEGRHEDEGEWGKRDGVWHQDRPNGNLSKCPLRCSSLNNNAEITSSQCLLHLWSLSF